MRQKSVRGFQTGDLVKAVVPAGKKTGTHLGRVAIRASGSFNIQTAVGVVQGIGHAHCRLIQRGDGYGYALQAVPSRDIIQPNTENATAQSRGDFPVYSLNLPSRSRAEVALQPCG